MKLSLKAKAILMIVLVSLLIGTAGIVAYERGVADIITKEYESRSLDIANAMSEIVNANQVKSLRDAILKIYDAEAAAGSVVLSDQWGTPEFDAYVAKFSEIESSSEFRSLREELRQVQDAIDVDCLYITWIDDAHGCSLYLVDGAYEDACPPGCADPLFLSDDMDAQNLKDGCPPNVTHTKEYGYLMSTGMPIRTADGELVGFAAVDLSMNEMIDHEHNLLLRLIVVFVIATIVTSLIGIFVVDRTIVRPINLLSKTATTYTANDLRFSGIDIHTGDEIETLADSMKRMELDMKEYYDNLMATKLDLATARESAEEYRREANIDALTGLRNKRAYDLAITALEKGDDPYAIAMIDLNDLKVINDQYGHDKGDVAIKNLADLICHVFKHSPVFRFGGDEFVVIMTDGDLESREGLIGRFRDEIRRSSEDGDLQPWERLSAACGYAVYDPRLDADAASVFKRADEDMYVHKIRMKDAASSVR